MGVHGTIFIKFERDDLDPAKVVTELLDDVRETGMSRSRYAVRFIPVHDSCYAKPAEAAAMCEKLAKEYGCPLDIHDSLMLAAICNSSRASAVE